MYIIFIDESGQPGGWDKDKNCLVNNTSKFFTLGGFMIDANEILNIERKFKDIKLKYGLRITDEVKWSGSYKKLNLDYATYIKMRKEILEMIATYNSSTVCVCMDKEECYKNRDDIANHNDIYAFALNLLMERMHMEIEDRDGRGCNTPALIFTDSRKNNNNNKLDKELQIAYLRAIGIGTQYISFNNFCESLVFIDSTYSHGIQCADFCAGAIHQLVENKKTEAFEIIKPALRNKKGTIRGYGIKIFK